MPAPYALDLASFRTSFPAFADTTLYPDVTLTGYYGVATDFIANSDYGALSGDSRALSLNLMTAHFAALFTQLAGGTMPGYVTSASIDKISVSMEPPPAGSQFMWWLNQTPYGQQLAALLSLKAVGGWYVGGSPVGYGFRNYRNPFC